MAQEYNGIEDIGEQTKKQIEEGFRGAADAGGRAAGKGAQAAIKSFRSAKNAAGESIRNTIASGATPANMGAAVGTGANAGAAGAGAAAGTAGAGAAAGTAGAGAAAGTAGAGAAAGTAGAAGTAAGTTAVAAGATAAETTNPVGWVILIISAILLLLFIGYIFYAIFCLIGGEDGQNLAYIDYQNIGAAEDFDTAGSYQADKSKMSSSNLACLAYYEALANKTVLQESVDENGNPVYIPYNAPNAKHDKFDRDRALKLDYNLLFALNDRVFGDTYVFPEGFLNPVAHDKDYNLCAISDEDGNLNSLFTTGISNMSYEEKDETSQNTDADSSSTEHPTKHEEKEAEKKLEKTMEESEETVKIKDGDFVIVTDYIPDIHISLAYASTENFTKEKIYQDNTCYLRYGTVQKLAKVQEQVKAAGYGGLMIWDGYRPQDAVDKLYNAYPDKTYVAQKSSHTKGNTIDLTIVDSTGAPVEMPSAFDTFNATADTDYSDVSAAAGTNAAYLTEIMTRNGFRGYDSEWWHFTDTKDYAYQDKLDVSSEEKKTTHTTATLSEGSKKSASAGFDDIGISTLCSYKQVTSTSYLKGTYTSKILINAETGEEKNEPLEKAIAFNVPIRTESFDVLDKSVSMWQSVTYQYNDIESCVAACSDGRSSSPADNVSQIQQADEVREEEVEETRMKYPVLDKDGKTVKEFDSEADANAYLSSHAGHTPGTPYEKTEKVKKQVTYHVYYVRGSGSGLYETSCTPAGTEKKIYDNTYLYQYLQSAVINSPDIERDYETFRNFSSYAGQGAFLSAADTHYDKDGSISATSSQQGFISLVGPLCIEEALHTGIYPSLLMAQFILESGWGGSSFEDESGWGGESLLGKKYYNYVGMTSSSKEDGAVITFWDGSTWTRKTYQGTDRGWADFSACGSREAGTIACIRTYGRNFWTSGYYDNCGCLNHVSAGLSIEEAKTDCLKQLSEYAPIYAPPTENNDYEGKIKRLINDYDLWSLDAAFLSEGGFDGTAPYEKESAGGSSIAGAADTSTAQVGSLNDEDKKTFSVFYHATDKDVLAEIDHLTYTEHHLNLGESDVDEILRAANRFTYGLSIQEEHSQFSHDDLLQMSLLIKDRDSGMNNGGHVTGDWVYYLQYEGPWAGKMYGLATYAQSGCGPTSLAMVIASLIDKEVTPDVVGEAVIAAGYRTAHDGTANGYCKAVAEQFGYYCETYDVSEPGVIEKVENCLKTGGAVCWSSGSQPFTSGGHCMALRGITDDGKWLVADPNDNTSKNHNATEFDPEFITSRWHCVVELIWTEKP